MYKLQIQWLKEGDWEPTVYPASDYKTTLSRLHHYSKTFTEHNYRVITS